MNAQAAQPDNISFFYLCLEWPPLPRAFRKMANKNSTEPAIHLRKYSYYDNDFVKAERKAVPWKRDFEKTIGTDSIL